MVQLLLSWFALILFICGTLSSPIKPKQNSKRSLDYVLDPFPVDYKHLDTLFPTSYQETIQQWNDVVDHFPNYETNSVIPLPVEKENGHVSPDFSNGLDYPDPYLLVGYQAKRAAQALYSKELFFGDIPHVTAILRNLKERESNGLNSFKLGSLNINSPFARKDYYHF